MSTSSPSTAAAAPLPRSPAALAAALCALRTFVQRADAWLAARKRAREDRRTLAAMSDRELRDIGIDRGSVAAVADGAWTRDYPH
jgi:uncharacterized protein YjiS (DUF1127 family)